MLLAIQDMARTTQDTTFNLEKDFSSMKTGTGSKRFGLSVLLTSSYRS